MLLAWLPYVASLAALCCQPGCLVLPAWLPIAHYLLVFDVGRIKSLHSDQNRHIVVPCPNLFHLLFYPDARNYFFFATSLLWKNVRFHCPVCHHIPECFTHEARCLFVIGRRLIPAPTIPFTRCRKYFHSSLTF